MSSPVRSGRGELTPRERAAQAHRQVVVMSAGLTVGVVTFAGVVAALLTSGTVEALSPLPAAATWGLAGAGLVALVAGRILGPRLREGARGASGAEVAGRWVSGSVVGAALAEVPGMIGGMIGLLDGDLVLLGALAAASVVGILTGIPSREQLEQELRRRG